MKYFVEFSFPYCYYTFDEKPLYRALFAHHLVRQDQGAARKSWRTCRNRVRGDAAVRHSVIARAVGPSARNGTPDGTSQAVPADGVRCRLELTTMSALRVKPWYFVQGFTQGNCSTNWRT